MIYFAEAKGLDLIKIGFSKNPKKRIKILNFGSPVKIELIKTIEGSLDTEYLIHRKFKEFRKRGEWFLINNKLIDFIGNVKDFPFDKERKKYPKKSNKKKTFYIFCKRRGGNKMTIPRKIIDVNNLNWNHKDVIILIPKEIEGKNGLFLSKEGVGHFTRYSYYEKTQRSTISIPPILLEAEDLDWNHKDPIVLIVKEIDKKKGIFIYKKEE